MNKKKDKSALTLDDVTGWWETDIVDIAPGSIRIRGYAIEELIGNISFPAMIWLVDGPTFGKLLVVELWLSFVYGSYNGAMVVFLTEIMPVDFRTAGFSLAYSLAAGVFGGFTPALSTYLIHITGNRAIPGLWLSFAAGCGLIAAMIARPQTSDVVDYALDATAAARPTVPAQL